MLQAKHFMTAAALCAVGLLTGGAVQAETTLETDRLPSAPAIADDELPEATTDAATTDEGAEAEPLECPPGQFPSAFADVYPFEWAYQAVNNLASPMMQCFDLPEEYR